MGDPRSFLPQSVFDFLKRTTLALVPHETWTRAEEPWAAKKASLIRTISRLPVRYDDACVGQAQ